MSDWGSRNRLFTACTIRSSRLLLALTVAGYGLAGLGDQAVQLGPGRPLTLIL